MILDKLRYIIIDKRTGKQSCSGIWSKELALGKIQEFKDRQAKGGRPDIDKETVDSLTIKEVAQ
jgi:hypothetical protein